MRALRGLLVIRYWLMGGRGSVRGIGGERGGAADASQRRRYAGRGGHATGTVAALMGDWPGCFAPLFGWAVGTRRHGWEGMRPGRLRH